MKEVLLYFEMIKLRQREISSLFKVTQQVSEGGQNQTKHSDSSTGQRDKGISPQFIQLLRNENDFEHVFSDLQIGAYPISHD